MKDEKSIAKFHYIKTSNAAAYGALILRLMLYL